MPSCYAKMQNLGDGSSSLPSAAFYFTGLDYVVCLKGMKAYTVKYISQLRNSILKQLRKIN